MLADVGRYTVLWQYGGIYQDIKMYLSRKQFCQTVKQLGSVNVIFEAHPKFPWTTRNTDIAARPHSRIMGAILNVTLHRLDKRLQFERVAGKGPLPDGITAETLAFMDVTGRISKGHSIFHASSLPLIDFARHHRSDLSGKNKSVRRDWGGCFAAGAACSGLQLETCTSDVGLCHERQPADAETYLAHLWRTTPLNWHDDSNSYALRHKDGHHWSVQNASLFGPAGVASFDRCMQKQFGV
jgi:hypothetical protein